jgi:hypothetical protein
MAGAAGVPITLQVPPQWPRSGCRESQGHVRDVEGARFGPCVLLYPPRPSCPRLSLGAPQVSAGVALCGAGGDGRGKSSVMSPGTGAWSTRRRRFSTKAS